LPPNEPLRPVFGGPRDQPGLVGGLDLRHHDAVRAAVERAGNLLLVEVIDPDHAHHAPEVARPGHVVEVLPGRREVLHLAHHGVEAEAAEELAHLG